MLHQIPNLLCLLRLVLTPFCVAAIVEGRAAPALILFTIAGFTDFLDGYLARRMNWQSPIGAYLDPAADKFLMAGVYLALGWTGAVPLWLVALIFGRDTSIVAGAMYIRQRRGITKFPPTWAGKVSTTIQIVAAVAILCVDSGLLHPIWRTLAILATAAGTGYSFLDYVRIGWRMMNAREEVRK